MNLKDIPSRDLCFYILIVIAAIASLCLIAAMTGLFTMFFVKLFCIVASLFIFMVAVFYAFFGRNTSYHTLLSSIFILIAICIMCLAAYVCTMIDLIPYK